MKFEKLNEDKLRIILTQKDLLEKHLNSHTFMANTIESQDLFLFALDKAEKEIGFSTKNCKIKIEAFAINSGEFILTITKMPSEHVNSRLFKKE